MKAISLLATLAVCTIVVVVESQVPEAFESKFHKICRDEAGASEADIKKFIENGMKASDGKNTVKCHIKCLMEKQGVLKNGLYNAELGKKELLKIPPLKEHQAEVTQAVNRCKNEKGANDCDTAFKIVMCLKEFGDQTTAEIA